MSNPPLRVVVRLPGHRPENPIPDPPQIEWTQEKADILWKVIERSRSVDSGGADWKGLAAHLEVPLPYLLYRVNARFQEEIKGLKDIQDTLSPGAAQPPPSPFTADTHVVGPTSPTRAVGERPSPLQRLQTRMSGSSRLSSSSKLNTPLGVRARLNSLTNNAPRPKKPVISSSTLTLQASRKGNITQPHRRTASPFSGSDDDSEDDSDEEHARNEEEAERAAEEQELLSRRLEELQRMMTNENIGLVSTARPRRRSLNLDRGRLGALSPRSVGSASVSASASNHSSLGYRADRDHRGPNLSSSRSGSQSVSDTGSPQGSIPDIPSPAGGSQPQSPRGRYGMSGANAQYSNGPSPRWMNGQRHVMQSDSSHGSETSSFTDLSDASLSQSALESALMSNIRGGGSRLSQFVPTSRVVGSRSTRHPR